MANDARTPEVWAAWKAASVPWQTQFRENKFRIWQLRFWNGDAVRWSLRAVRRDIRSGWCDNFTSDQYSEVIEKLSDARDSIRDVATTAALVLAGIIGALNFLGAFDFVKDFTPADKASAVAMIMPLAMLSTLLYRSWVGLMEEYKDIIAELNKMERESSKALKDKAAAAPRGQVLRKNADNVLVDYSSALSATRESFTGVRVKEQETTNGNEASPAETDEVAEQVPKAPDDAKRAGS